MIGKLTVQITLLILSGFILSGCCSCAFAEDKTIIESGLEFLSSGKVQIAGSGEMAAKENAYSGFDAVTITL